MRSRIDGWRPLFEMSRARADTVEPGLAAFVAAELAASKRLGRENLPEGVIHADLFPDNVFFLRGKLSGLIDFYFACNDLLAYDLAVCLNAWCFEPDNSFNVTKGRALLAGLSGRAARLRPAERAALPMLARGAALRFLLTRLYDWLTVPPARSSRRRIRANISASSASIRREKRRRLRHGGMTKTESASSFTPTAPAPAIPGRAAGARSCASTGARRSSPAARRRPPTTAWS